MHYFWCSCRQNMKYQKVNMWWRKFTTNNTISATVTSISTSLLYDGMGRFSREVMIICKCLGEWTVVSKAIQAMLMLQYYIDLLVIIWKLQHYLPAVFETEFEIKIKCTLYTKNVWHHLTKKCKHVTYEVLSTWNFVKTAPSFWPWQ